MCGCVRMMQVLYMRGNVNLSFWVWFISFYIMISRPIHFPVSDIILFFGAE